MEDENLVDVATDESVDVEEVTNNNESGDEEAVDYEQEFEKQRKANAQILARAKRAEEENKRLKNAKTPAQPTITQPNPELSDELKLIARGLSDEEIEQAKVVAKGKGINLIEATKDPLFTIFQSDLKEKEKRENAKLGASKGSGDSTNSEIIKPDMTREEHEKAFKKVMGN
jgi:hypothetical protein